MRHGHIAWHIVEWRRWLWTWGLEGGRGASRKEVKKEGLRKEPSRTAKITEQREVSKGDREEAGKEAEEPGDAAGGPRKGPRGQGILGSGL